MADAPMAIYWDSDVIIHRIQRTPDHIDILEYLTSEAENNRLLIVVSTFTIVEVNRSNSLPPLTEEQDKLISDYFENDYIVIRPLTIPIAKLARDIARTYRIKPKDAVHVATSVFWKVPLMHTYDKDLCSKTDLISDPPLKIENPNYINQVPLFAAMRGVVVQEPATPEQTATTDNMPSQTKETVNEESEPQPVIPVEETERIGVPESAAQSEGQKVMLADADNKPDTEPPATET